MDLHLRLDADATERLRDAIDRAVRPSLIFHLIDDDNGVLEPGSTVTIIDEASPVHEPVSLA